MRLWQNRDNTIETCCQWRWRRKALWADIMRDTCFERKKKELVMSFNKTVMGPQVLAVLFGAMSMHDWRLDSNPRTETRPETSNIMHAPTILQTLQSGTAHCVTSALSWSRDALSPSSVSECWISSPDEVVPLSIFTEFAEPADTLLRFP